MNVKLKKQANAPGGFCITQAKFVHCGRGKDPEETEPANELLPKDLLDNKTFIVDREDFPRMTFKHDAEERRLRRGIEEFAQKSAVRDQPARHQVGPLSHHAGRWYQWGFFLL